MRNHSKLKVFQLADKLAIQIYSRTTAFPREERYGLSSQMRRAAVSTVANIVEGAARPSEADFARFLAIAYGSARELEYEITLAKRLAYLTSDDSTHLLDAASQTGKALRSLILTLSGDRTK